MFSSVKPVWVRMSAPVRISTCWCTLKATPAAARSAAAGGSDVGGFPVLLQSQSVKIQARLQRAIRPRFLCMAEWTTSSAVKNGRPARGASSNGAAKAIVAITESINAIATSGTMGPPSILSREIRAAALPLMVGAVPVGGQDLPPRG